MKLHSKVKFAGVVAVVSLLAMGTAQACMPGVAGKPGAFSCAAAQGTDKSCPTQAQQAGQGHSCQGDRQEMMQAMGSMAKSGMEMAAQMMRALSEGLDGHPRQGI